MASKTLTSSELHEMLKKEIPPSGISRAIIRRIAKKIERVFVVSKQGALTEYTLRSRRQVREDSS